MDKHEPQSPQWKYLFNLSFLKLEESRNHKQNLVSAMLFSPTSGVALTVEKFASTLTTTVFVSQND